MYIIKTQRRNNQSLGWDLWCVHTILNGECKNFQKLYMWISLNYFCLDWMYNLGTVKKYIKKSKLWVSFSMVFTLNNIRLGVSILRGVYFKGCCSIIVFKYTQDREIVLSKNKSKQEVVSRRACKSDGSNHC